MTLKQIFSALLSATVFLQASQVMALDLESSFSGQSAGQSEYFNSNRNRKMLIQVSILSGVNKPGVHQIPDTTNIVDALALAGGLTSDADFEKVFVKRKKDKGFETIEYDVNELVQSNQFIPPLQNYDTILIENQPKTDQRLLTYLAIIASTVGIVSSTLLIRDTLRRD